MIHFEGELLLQGQHDAVVISILAEGAAPPAPAPAPAPAKRQGSKESTKSEEKFKVDTSQLDAVNPLDVFAVLLDVGA